MAETGRLLLLPGDAEFVAPPGVLSVDHVCQRCRQTVPIGTVNLCPDCKAALETAHTRAGEERNRRPDSLWQETLDRIMGLNRFGDSNARIVWALSILENVAGLWTDLDPETGDFLRQVAGVRTVQKYAHIGERWIIEKWIAPEKYGSPEEWDRQNEQIIGMQTFDTLGAFPHRGGYEHVLTFEIPDTNAVPEELRGKYLEPTVQRIERWCAGCATAARMNYFERLAAIKTNMERKEKIREQIESDKYDDLCKRAFYGASFVTHPGHPDTGERSTK